MRIFLLIATLFLTSLVDAKEVTDLTLIPPGKITDKVDLDIRGGITNHSDVAVTYDIHIRIKGNGIDRTLVRERKEIAGRQSSTISYNLETEGLAGRYTVIFTARKGLRTYREKRQTEIIPSDQRATGTIDGAWIGLYHWSETEGKHWNKDIRKLTAEDWKGVVRSMHEIGMDIIVVQEVFRNQLYAGKHDIDINSYEGLAFYPSELYPGRMDIACPDALEAIMDEADRLGMHVLPGIGMFAWFDFSKESLEWHKAVTEEIWKMYGHHSSFYGFYVSEEQFGSLDNGERTPEMQDYRKQEMVEFFKDYKQFCRLLAPSKPVMLATNSMQITKAEDTYPELLQNLDILCPFGFARMPEGDLTGQEAAQMLQSWCDEAGSHLWFDLEAFLFNPDTSLYPRDIDGIVSDLTMLDNFEKVLCYQYPGVFNNPEFHPLIGDPRSIRLYNDYRNYINPVPETGLSLTPPASATDKTDVDIQVGIVNSTDSHGRYIVRLIMRNNSDRRMLKKETVDIEAGRSLLLTHTLKTEGLEGKYEVILKVRKGLKTQTISRKIEIIPSQNPSYEMLNGAWTGCKPLPEFTADDWKGIARSMHHIGMDMILISHGLSELNGNDAVSNILKEADNNFMHAAYEIYIKDNGMTEAVNEALNTLRLHGHHPSFYGFCLSGDIRGIENFKEQITAQAPALQIIVSTDRVHPDCEDYISKADIAIATPQEQDIQVKGNRLWLNVPTEDTSDADIEGSTILSHMKNVGMMNIEGLKKYIITHNTYAKAIFGEYLGIMDNPCFHALAGGKESIDLNVSYTAYSMYKEWLKPYSVPPGAKTVRNPKGLLKEDKRREDCLTVEIKQKGDPRIRERHWQAIPVITTDSDADVTYMAWNAGGRDEEMGNYITVAVSEDQGETWMYDEMVIYPKNPLNTRILDPVIWRGHDQKIYLKFTITMSDYGDQLDPMTSSHQMRIAWNGEKIEFTEPEFLTYGLMINPPTYIPGKDLTLYPICRCSMNHLNRMRYKENPEKGTYAYSMKNGKFKLYSRMPEVDYSLYDFEEHQFLCLDEEGKELMCIARFRNGTNKSFSNDYGRTWTDFEPMPEIGPSTSSKACIQRLKSGKVMLIYNNATDRSMMTVAISDDNCKTWSYKAVIDERPLTSYPAASQAEDGTIFVAYDRDRYHDMDIHFLRFAEEDIINGNTDNIYRRNLTKADF